VLALADVAFGSMRVGVALIAAGCVLLVYALGRELGLTVRTRVIACALFALSPFAVIQSALFLEYLFAVMLEMAVLTLLLAGLRSDANQRARRLAAAGFVYGLLVFTRPLEALMLGVAMALYLVVRERSLLRAVRHLPWPAVGALPVVALMLAYNMRLTGNPVRFPLWAIGGNNSFGFGKRNIVDGSPLIDATFTNSVKALHQNLRSLPHWMFGSVIVVPLALYGLWHRRRDSTTVLLAAIGILFPLAYLFYWGNLLIVNGRKQIGPHYYMALMVPTVVFAAVALERLLHRWKVVAFAVFTAMIAATAIEVPDKVDRNDHFTDAYRAEQEAIDAAVAGDAVVIVPTSADGPYLLHPRGWLSNDLTLENGVLYAADRGAENIALVRRFPGRRLYRLQAVEATRAPLQFRPSVRELVVDRSAVLQRTLTATVPDKHTRVRAYVETTGSNRRTCDVAAAGRMARAIVTVQMRTDQVRLSGCAGDPINLSAPPDLATLAVGFEFIGREPGHIEARELRVWTATEGSQVVSLNDELWRIVPYDRVPRRVIEGNTDLVVTV
jgi:hypothetical protein